MKTTSGLQAAKRSDVVTERALRAKRLVLFGEYELTLQDKERLLAALKTLADYDTVIDKELAQEGFAPYLRVEVTEAMRRIVKKKVV